MPSREPPEPPGAATAAAPELGAEAGWEPLEPPRLEGGRGSFVTGEPSGDRLRVRYFRRREEPALVGKAWFGPGSAGPPGHAHGGAITAVLDEAMGAASWLAGHLGVAVHLETDFRRLLPVGTVTRFEAWVAGAEGRKVRAAARLEGEDGELYAEANALFVTLDPERFGGLVAQAARSLGLDPEELLRKLRGH